MSQKAGTPDAQHRAERDHIGLPASTSREVTILAQHDNDVRRIFMDVPHSENPKPSWYGESVGYYEGAVDTTGLNDKTFIDNFVIGLLQFVLGKLRQVRVVDIGHPKRRLSADVIGNVLITWVLPDWGWTSRKGSPSAPNGHPPHIAAGKAGRSLLGGRDSDASTQRDG
jgi:hypothetical protein